MGCRLLLDGRDLQRVDELEVAVDDAHLGDAHHPRAVGPELRLAAEHLPRPPWVLIVKTV